MLLCILRSTSNWGLLLIWFMLLVMLAFFFFHLIRLHLTDFFHHLLLWVLQQLQHFDKNVNIFSRDSLLLLGFSPRSADTFRLVGLVLVGCCWPWLCLWGHSAHVLCCFRSWGHSLRGLSSTIPVFFPTPQQSCQCKCGGPFCNCRLGYLLLC